MLVVHKFPLRTTDRQEIYLPVSAKVLTVQVQHGTPCLWALVDEDADLTKHSLTIVGTGHPVGSVGEYIGTYQLDSGALVFHVFNSLN